MSQDSLQLKNSLEQALKPLNTRYGCVLVKGRVLVASDKWLELNKSEIYLLSLLTLTLTTTTANDIPIYLPYKTPHVCLMKTIFAI
jgi:DNA topoisomerase 2-associated protein PAT1